MSIEENIAKVGKKYKPALLPKDIPRLKMGECFDNCASISLDGKYKYVEGVGILKEYGGMKILHAWLTDGVHAFDPTWKAIDKKGREFPVPAEYIGIEMEIENVAEFMMETECAGVIANFYLSRDLAKQAIGSLFPKIIKKKHG